MNKEQLENFDKMGVKSGLYNACVEVDDIKKFISKIKAETRQEIINYQHGFVRDDGFGNPERAPEWQVIEDLIKTLKQ